MLLKSCFANAQYSVCRLQRGNILGVFMYNGTAMFCSDCEATVARFSAGRLHQLLGFKVVNTAGSY